MTPNPSRSMSYWPRSRPVSPYHETSFLDPARFA